MIRSLIATALLLPLLQLSAAADSPAKFVLPSTFGNYSLGSCSDAPPCGTVMASLNGVGAMSNGQYQCTGNSCGGYGTWGYEYQCVDYFNVMYGVAPIWWANAIDMCNSHPSGVYQVSSPSVGDLVVFNWQPWGHVAVVSGSSGDALYVVEQNSSPSGQNTYSKSGSGVLCYLSAK